MNIFDDRIYIFGDDSRQLALFNLFLEKGYNAAYSTDCFSNDNKKTKYSHHFYEDNLCTGTDFLIFPIPLKKRSIDNLFPFAHKNNYIIGGLFDKELTAFCYRNNICYYDLYLSKNFVTSNAKITAEGAIFCAMQNSTKTIAGSKSLVIGYGNCGCKIAGMLKCMNSEVHVIEPAKKTYIGRNIRLYKNITEVRNIHRFDFIFNTAPQKTLVDDILCRLKKNVTIIDIASAPGGTDFDYCKKYGICAKLCPGIPGHYAPDTAARIIFNEIVNLKREG